MTSNTDKNTNNINDNIVNSFLEIYEKKLAQNTKIEFNQIFDQTLSNLNLLQYKEEIKNSFGEHLNEIYNQLYQQSYLSLYIQDTSIFEILLHSPRYIQLDKGGSLENIDIDEIDHQIFQLSLESMAAKEQKKWNYKTPFVSFNISFSNHNFRATLIHYSITPGKCSKLFLRRISSNILEFEHFNVDFNLQNELINLVHSKKNILIAGSTGSGKTTFLKTLMAKIPDHEHIIVLEDTFEINSPKDSQSNLLALDNSEGKSLKDYCSYAMRMRPDRMIIGEMRSNEVVPFVLAMNTGHKGLMSTIHANNAVDALSRIALLFSIYSETKDLNYDLIMKLITSNIDYIIYLDNKKVLEMIKVLGSENGNAFYENIQSTLMT